jgi:UDP-GlcNAc3NAcA epimerase
MKIMTIVGARPQFIKAATVSRVFRRTRGLTEILVHTGQHYDKNMSDVFFKELDIPRADIHLGIGSASHGRQTGHMLEAIESAMLKEKPDWVLVYGDTNSTLAGALAAAKLGLSIAHVEAGLRSFNRAMPEEINRVVSDHVSDLLFAPTKTAVENLRREGIPAKQVAKVGDVMYDAALFYADTAQRCSNILDNLKLQPGGYVLATVHRAENTDNPAKLKSIFDALRHVSKELPVVLPLHPRTRAVLARLGLAKLDGIQIIPPVGYLDMVMLERHSLTIVTDSGGVQKEAYFYRVPCITLRGETEWVELVNAGWNRLLPPDGASLSRRLVAVIRGFRRPSRAPPLYGSGNAAELIAGRLKRT